MQFVLTGFTHESGCRVFSFERIGADRVRTRCTVRADLALIRKYGIHIQELPLLCRSLLDHSDETDVKPALTFAEAEMKTWADDRAANRAAASSRRKFPHKPPSGNTGAAWRGQPA